MPEQAEWVGNHVDGDNYTWDALPAGFRIMDKPLNLVMNSEQRDCRTADEKMNQRMAALETTVGMLVDEVQHLRDDIARMRTGESQL